MSFSAEEVADIQKSWELPKANLTDSGAAILVKYVTKYPENLPHFPFKDVPVADLSSNERFRSHVTKIMTVFDNSINALGSDEVKVTQIWEDLAKTHIKRHIPEKSYLELKDTIVEVLSEAAKLTDAQKVAWNKMLDHVYAILFKKLAELGA
ncbi:globin CTT-VIIB-7-like [Anastrepha obliqua]|uniref:globin CTT-VIIB-7-like n=1 Tax=Anastrepha obliqua TaxID=95512 RepID=UPI00240925E9|nr:globin CTT-VIIB-7-like [Anastrepha obliqua]XP_054746328.1 globin CTT-VIIB-7-like [Anastrepha obliqua]